MKKQVKLVNGSFMRLHYKPIQRVIQRGIEVANQYLLGEIRPRKLNNGKFEVLEVSRTERIVIDKDKNIHLMSHEKYNDYINVR